MPESKVRKAAADKKKYAKAQEAAKRRAEVSRYTAAPGSRRWVAPTFITVGLLGVIWLLVYYVAGNLIPFMAGLGNWNILIAMALIAASFSLATLWK